MDQVRTHETCRAGDEHNLSPRCALILTTSRKYRAEQRRKRRWRRYGCRADSTTAPAPPLRAIVLSRCKSDVRCEMRVSEDDGGKRRQHFTTVHIVLTLRIVTRCIHIPRLEQRSRDDRFNTDDDCECDVDTVHLLQPRTQSRLPQGVQRSDRAIGSGHSSSSIHGCRHRCCRRGDQVARHRDDDGCDLRLAPCQASTIRDDCAR